MQAAKTVKKFKKRFYPLSGLGIYILVDSSTGEVYCLDKGDYNAITSVGKNGIDSRLIYELKDLLSQLDLKTDLKKTARKLERRAFYPRGICLNVSDACNMRCRYCFTYKNSKFSENLLMPLESALRSVDFLMETKYPSVEIDFFGGEPLLNWKVVKDTINYAEKKSLEKKKKLRLALTTNGILLNEDIGDFLNSHDVNLTLSLDGPSYVNDSMRKCSGRKGTFFKVVKNFKKVLEKRKYTNYYIRGTYTGSTLEFFNSAKFLINEGFKSFSLEPVAGEGEEFSIKPDHMEIIENQYRSLAELYLKTKEFGRLFSFYHFNLHLYNNQPCLEKRLLSCSAGMEYLAVSADGKIYPCHQFVGKKKFCLGDIKNGIINDALQVKFRKANVLNQNKCLNCWAKLYCSGGCYASNFNATGNILKPDIIACQLMKIRLKYALLLEVKQRGDYD